MTLPGLLVQVGFKYLFDISGKDFVGWIDSRFRDSAGSVPAAIFRANQRSWQAVALAVSDDSFRSRVRDLARDADMKAARDRVRDLVPAALRPAAAGDLAALRGTVTEPPADPADVLRLYADPAGLAAAAVRAAATVADELPAAPHLAAVLRLAPGGGPGLFESLFRHFLRAAVAADPETAARFTQSQFDGLAATLDARTAGVLDQLSILFDGLDAGFGVVNAKLDAQADQLRVIQDTLAAPRKPGVSYDTEDMRAYLLAAKAAFLRTGGAVPAEHWGRLGDALREARLYTDAGDAHARAAATAHAARDPDSEAANHYQTYLDACEAGDWDRAAAALWAAVDLAPARYAPFDRHRYAVQRILGGGAFGTVFHCLDRYARDEDEQPTPVAIKAFRGEKLGCDLGRVFREAGMTKLLRHDSIIGLIDQGFGDPAGQLRPYLVLEYFPGQSLDRYLTENGPLPVADFLAVARRVAEAVHAAHSLPRPVFHRDLKPANVMVRRHPDGSWAVKVIDFGLAVRGPAIRTSLNVPHALRSTEDKAVTGTIKYSPPEQLGELPGVEVGPYSDVYAYGKTCLDLVFRHTQPDDDEWNELVPEPYRTPLKKLLTQCVRPALDGKFPRLRSFAPVLEALAALELAAADARGPREQEETERRSRENLLEKFAALAELIQDDKMAREVAAAEQARQAAADRDQAERLELWKRSGQPRAWVEQRLDGWDHRQFTALVAGLKTSPYWPLDPTAIQEVLDGLFWPLRAQRDLRRAETQQKRLTSGARPVDGEKQGVESRSGKGWELIDEAHKGTERNRNDEVTRRTADKETKLADPFDPGRTRAAGDKLRIQLPGGVKMTFAWCPPGTFQMGSNHPQGFPCEKPVHRVTLSNGFYTGIHVVTAAQWTAVMKTDHRMSTELDTWYGPKHPMVKVSWDEAQEFCTRLTLKLKGRVALRLPTEAEWEYAARAGTTTEYHFGDSVTADLANYNAEKTWNGSSTGRYRCTITRVGKFPANPWGLHDVHGNVWEWCQDAWDEAYYAKSPERDPVCKSDVADGRVVRGGSWFAGPKACRAAFRSWVGRYSFNMKLGFRVCFSLNARSES